MKLMINYDLLDKIREAKTGFSLEKTVKPALSGTIIATTLKMCIIPLMIPIDNQLKVFSALFAFSLAFQSLVSISANLTLERYIKDFAKRDLEKLAFQLSQVGLNVDQDLILNSYKYKTEYNFLKDDNPKNLVQKKYIMVPVIENGKETEISILQEHIVGSKVYSISKGEPPKQKVFKLATNPI